jgi:multidrug efflux pump subunit AcrA (membrane-fusion protein)
MSSRAVTLLQGRIGFGMARILWVIVVLAAAAGAAVGFTGSGPPVLAKALLAAAGALALVLLIGLLPLRARRAAIFCLVFVLLAGLGGGLYYFQFTIKPDMVKGFITAAFAPKPTAVSAEAAVMEKWIPQMPAIGSLRAYQGIDISTQVAGVISAIHFKSSQDVAAGAPLVQIDDSVDQADLKNGMAQLRNADVSLERRAATPPRRRSIRRSRRATRPPRRSSARARSSPRRRSRRRSPAGSASARSMSGSSSRSGPASSRCSSSIRSMSTSRPRSRPCARSPSARPRR